MNKESGYQPKAEELEKATDHLTEFPDSVAEEIKDDDSDTEVERKVKLIDKYKIQT